MTLPESSYLAPLISAAWKQLFSATWKIFQEDIRPVLNDLRKHRELIERAANLRQIQASREERLLSQASFAALEKEVNRSKIRTICVWLSATDSREDQENFSSKRRDITDSGKWVLEEPKIVTWLDPQNCGTPVLWMTGKPGAGGYSARDYSSCGQASGALNGTLILSKIGKTVLASVIIERAQSVLDSASMINPHIPVSLAYFYCGDVDTHKNTFSSVAKALLAQIFLQNSDRPEILAFFYDECVKSWKSTLESPQECGAMLEIMLNTFPRAFIIIDGVDKCQSQERKAIMKFFISAINKNSADSGKLRCLFISRDLDDIRNGLEGSAILHLTEKHVKRDIENYVVWYTLEIEKKHHGMPQDAKDYIVRSICEGSDGMFLFAKLVLENLNAQSNLEDVYMELQQDISKRSGKGV